jgi:hypothetical protein
VLDLERVLVQVGAIEQNDSRLKPEDGELEQRSGSSVRAGKPSTAPTDDDDSDWD